MLKKEYPNQRHCPSCNRYLKFNSEHPIHACLRCIRKAEDEQGRAIYFEVNGQIVHSFTVYLSKTKEPIELKECSANGMKFTPVLDSLNQLVLIPLEQKAKRKRKPRNTELVIIDLL